MNEIIKKSRYKHVDGKQWIEVRVRNHLQLFDARDPAPFRERDLDDEFIEYILACTKEFSIHTPLKMAIYIDEEPSKDIYSESIIEAIRSYLGYQIDLQKTELRSFVRRSQIYLIVGLLFLVGCLGLAQTIQVPESPGMLGILREGIVIFGWVSIWKPIELILFDWYPLYEKLRYFKKLNETEISIKFSKV